jgi:hypothetical protein
MANANVNEEILRITIDSTSKEEDKAICERYEYNWKSDSKGRLGDTDLPQSIRWKCNKCAATITTDSEIVTKINGKKVENPTSA